MLEVQRYLRSGKSLEELSSEYSIRITIHDSLPLAILNYSQLNSPKTHPIVRECRGLTLEIGTWNVVARSFPRFFNAGECPDLESQFDWTAFSAQSKEDGSLMLLYRYNNHWMVNTRGSFATGEIAPGLGKTWEDVFYSALDEVGMDDLYQPGDSTITYVFELCSPYNKVVRDYPRPKLYLLSAFCNETDIELFENTLDYCANSIRVERPRKYEFATLASIVSFLEDHDEATFEGMVLRDRNGMRLKVKNSRYVALHHLKDNGNLFNAKSLVPLILKNEQAEVLGHFPELAEPLFDMIGKLYGPHGRMMAVWDAAKVITNQKEFALFVIKHTEYAAVLFEARKRKVDPASVWLESSDLLLKKLSA